MKNKYRIMSNGMKWVIQENFPINLIVVKINWWRTRGHTVNLDYNGYGDCFEPWVYSSESEASSMLDMIVRSEKEKIIKQTWKVIKVV